MFRATLVLVCVLFAGCYGPTSPDPELVTVELTLQGRVTSTSGPVAGATVEFGRGGSFTIPGVVTRSTTDAAGHYQLHATIQCGYTWGDQLWVIASAPGFEAIPMGTFRYVPKCANGVQQIHISLKKLP